MGLNDVKHIVLVLSGKGGVGKSSVAVHLAFAFRRLGYKVGLLDIDLCGPSIPFMLNVEDKDVHMCPEGWVPVFTDQTQTLSVMSIGFLLNDRKDAVVWRGPKKNAMIKQFLTDVHWQERDFLIIDMPPGTSDEHISLIENLKNQSDVGAILITTPQAVAVNDVRREVTFCQKTGVPVIGIVENMSGFVCSNCKECTAAFSRGGGEALSQETNIPFLGSIPLDPSFGEFVQPDSGNQHDESLAIQKIQQIANAIIEVKQ